jgi:hypothetical protein
MIEKYDDPAVLKARLDELEKQRNPEKQKNARYEPGLSFADYRALGNSEGEIFTVNASLLKEPTPLHAKFSLTNNKESDALSLGDVVHRAILEPDTFEEDFDKYYIISPTASLNTKACKDLRILYPDKTIIGKDHPDKVRYIRDAVMRNHLCTQILKDCTDRELTGITPDPDAAIVRKIRVDARPPISAGSFLADLKTARDIMPARFYYDFRRYGYHIQSAFYLDTDALITGEGVRNEFFIIAVTNEPPYYARVFTVPPEIIEEGRIIYTRRLAALVQAVAANYFPAFDHQSYPSPLSLDADE